MKKITKKLCILGCALIFLTIGCSGGSSGSGSDGPPPESATGLDTAKTHLMSGSFSNAIASYTSIIESDSTSSDEKSLSYFGRAFSNMILLVERSPFTDMLAGFGQAPWVTSTIFTTNGYLYKSFNEPPADKSNLPFYNIKTCIEVEFDKRPILGRCLISRTVSGYSLENIAPSLLSLMTYVDDIISDLSHAIEDSDIIFTIPKELYTGDIDIPVNHSDMVMILSSMYFIKAGTDLANSWVFNIDLGSLVDEDGNSLISERDLSILLNEQFVLRTPNRLVNARTNLQTGFVYAIQAHEEILAGASGGILNLSEDNRPLYEDFNSALTSANNSLGGTQAITGILPMVEVNLENFFTSPPNAADDAIEFQPFVYEDEGIKAVEGFWQEFINTALVGYSIGEDGIRAFSDGSRAVSRPYYQLFNVIMGHRFGKHSVSRGE